MARLIARIAALVLGISFFGNAHAQTYTYSFYLGNKLIPGGCSVSTPAGTVTNVRWRLQATVTAGVTPTFSNVRHSTCAAGFYTPALPVLSTSAIGFNTGAGGADAIEVRLPFTTVSPEPGINEVLAVVASGASASDALISTQTSGMAAKGSPTPAPILVPTLGAGTIGLLGLALLAIGWIVLRRNRHLLLFSMLLVAGTAWAVAIVVDGQVGDWASVPASTDPSGDVATPALDLTRLQVTSHGLSSYLRVDVANLQNPPVANPASATLLEDASTTITLTGSDPGGSPLTFQIATSPTRGTLGAVTPINATSASVLYTGSLDEFGSDSFSFTANNGSQTSTPATASITITPVNDAPSFAAADPPVANEGSGVQTVANWAAFDAGPNNESTQAVLQYLVSAIGNPALFSVAPSVAANGTLSYTLAPNANGSSSFSVAVRDDGGTANGGVDLSAAQSFTITVDAVNAAPTFTGGGNVASLEDAGAQIVPAWASAMNDGDTDQTQTLSFNVTGNTNPGLFAAAPSVDAVSGNLGYAAAPDANGTAQITLTLSDDGGTANGGSDTSAPYVFTVTVGPVNDAPSFTASNPPAVNEGSGAQSVPNWATFSAGPANESGQAAQQYLVSAIGNPALFSVAPSVAANGTLSYTVAPDVSGSSTFSVAVQDDGGTANGGVDLSTTQSFTITVNAVNSAPSFSGGGDVSALEDAGAQSVPGWAGAIDDGDSDQVQTLSFSVVGNTNPSLFASGPSIDPVTGTLSYTTAPDANGSAAISVVLGDDGGTANGGSDISAPYNFSVQTTAVNDAPSFSAANPPAVNEGSGAQSLPGWATFSPGPSNESGQAALEYLVGAVGNPGLFAVVPSVAPNGTLTYTVAPNVSGSSTFTVAVRDDGGTPNGGVDLSANQVFSITVNAVNSAPTFTGGGDVSSAEDAGAQTVVAWATAIDDGDVGEVQALTFNVTGNTNPALFAAGPVVNAANGNLSYTAAADVSGSATITLTLSDDGGTANGGSDTSASYDFTITVNATNDAPTATPKSHTTHSAIELEIVAAAHTGELLEGAADVDDPSGELTAEYIAGSATPAGAQVTVTNAADGSFRYDPPGGYSGAGSFQYRVCDDGVPVAPAQCSAPTTVTFTITGPELYFVDDSAAGGGDGGLNDPFDSLDDLPPARGSGDRIYLHSGTYSTAHALHAGEHLIGQGHSGNSDALLGVVAVGNGTLDSTPTAGAAPTVANTISFGGNNGLLRGVEIDAGSNTGISAGAVSGITVAESSVESSVTAVNFNGTDAGAAGVVLTSTTSTGGGSGIVLNNVSDTFDFGTGALSGHTGVSFLGIGTLGTTSYAGTISKTSSGNVVELNGSVAATDTGSVTLSGDLTCSSNCAGLDVVNRDTGTITFSGSTKAFSTGSNAAIHLDNNDTAQIHFTNGGLDLDTTSGIGFNAVNGAAAVTVETGTSANSIVSGTGIALNVVNSTIGAGGLTFQSISANGAPHGILLNSTGAVGGLTVTGNGGVCTVATPTCTGGTLQAHSDAGINLIATRNVSLALMRVHAGSDDGIRGNDVTHLAVADSVISGNGNALNEHGLDLTSLFGTASVTNTAITQSHHNNVLVRNNTGTLSLLDIAGSSISNNVSIVDGDGILLEASGTANMAISVSGSSFAAHRGDHFQAAALNNAVLDVDLSANTLSGGHASSLGQGITINAASGLPGFGGSVNYNIDGNTINGAVSSAVVLALGTSVAGSGMEGTVSDNLIGTAGNALSCSTQGHGISVDARGNGTVTALIENNTIRQCFDRGILSEAGDGDSTLNLTVTGNISDQQVAPGARESIQTNHGITSLNVFGNVDTNVVCLNLSGNTFSHGAGAPDDFRLRKRFEATVRLPGYAGGTGQDAGSLSQVVAFIRGQNTGSAGEPGSAAASGAGGGYTGGAACPLPL